jgi:hypothetical protein
MNGWIKHFADGSKEVGTDQAVYAKKASWSKGRLADMIGAEVVHGNKRIAILVPGEFWQSDDYDVSFLQSTPSLVKRRLQYKIQKSLGLKVEWQDDSVVVLLCPGFYATEEQVGQWVTIELDIKTGKFDFTVQENRI